MDEKIVGKVEDNVVEKKGRFAFDDKLKHGMKKVGGEIKDAGHDLKDNIHDLGHKAKEKM